jgi:glycosyltransferase involved in cell wall biosynthesis
VASGQDVRHLVPSDERIRYLHIGGNQTIGSLRNIGSGEARGQVICSWDDDDWSHPERVRDQVSRLIESGKAVTGYRCMVFTDGARRWQYRFRKDNYALGTSLCYTKAYWQRNPFPGDHIGEDKKYSRRAHEQGQLTSVDAGDLMVASIHPNNTSPRQLSGVNWTCLA